MEVVDVGAAAVVEGEDVVDVAAADGRGGAGGGVGQVADPDRFA
jgi:hypothetical protein